MTRCQEKKRCMLLLVICLIALLVTIFCESYFTILEQRASLEQLHTVAGWNDLFLAFSAKQFVCLFVCFIIIGIIIIFFRKQFSDFIYQYR